MGDNAVQRRGNLATRKKINDNKIEIIPIKIVADINHHDKLDSLILESVTQCGEHLLDGDIIVVTQKIVSKSEGRTVNLKDTKPSPRAIRLARALGKDPRLTELILGESKQVLRSANGVIIVETKHGLVCANAGVDQSNVVGDDLAVLLPEDPDNSASKLRESMTEKTGIAIAVIITDTFGRPFRNGQINVAIGVSGMNSIKSYIGELDMYGKKLKVTEIAVVDEIASSAELVMGKANSVPVVIVRGYKYEQARDSTSLGLIMSKEKDLFR